MVLWHLDALLGYARLGRQLFAPCAPVGWLALGHAAC